jgi:hypothetical protein
MLAVLICALLRCCWRHGGTVDLVGLQTDAATASSSTTTANDAHKYTAVTGQRSGSSSSSSNGSGAMRSTVSSADATAAREGVAVCCVTATAACAAVELLSGWRGPDGTHQVRALTKSADCSTADTFNGSLVVQLYCMSVDAFMLGRKRIVSLLCLIATWLDPCEQEGSGGVTFWLLVTAQAAVAFMQG